MTQEAILKRIVQKKGRESQIIKAIEELSELQKELCKYLEGDKSEKRTDKIIEEIADTELMIEQLRSIFEIDINSIIVVKAFKLARIEKILDTVETTQNDNTEG